MRSKLFAAACIAGALLGAAGTAGAKEMKTLPTQVRPIDLDEVERALREQRLTQAKVLLERARIAGQDEPRLQLLHAEYLLATGANAQALATFERLTSDPAHKARALQGAGIAALRLDDTVKARASLEAAVTADASLSRAWSSLAVAADLEKDHVRAEQAFGRALALTPRAFDVLSNRGYSRLMQKRFAEAVADLSAAARLAPKDETVRTNLTLALAMAGRYDEAVSGADRRQSARQQNNVGVAAAMRGDYATAETFFTEALSQSDVFYRTAWLNLLETRRLQTRPTDSMNGGPRQNW